MVLFSWAGTNVDVVSIAPPKPGDGGPDIVILSCAFHVF